MSTPTGARARRRVRTSFGQRARAVAPPVAAATLLALAWVLPGGADEDRAPESVTVNRSTYGCPAGGDLSLAAGQVTAGSSATGRSLPDKNPIEELGDAAAWRRTKIDADGVLMDQRGRGSGAVGFYGTTAGKSDGGGLVVGPCPPTEDQTWYLGAGSGGKHLTELVLTNLSSATAVADVHFWGTEGKIDAVDAEGIVVDPYSVRRVELADLAAGEAELAVRVDRRRGSLSVSAVDASTAVFRGTEAMESTAAPRRRQVVAGAPGGSGTRTLMLLNPGSSTARVGVEMFGAKGRFAPKGLDSVKVEAGRFVEVTVPASAGTDAAAVRLRSDHPVAAALRVAPDEKDHVVVESTGRVEGPAVVPLDLGLGTGPPQLVLTALREDGRVELTAHDAAMKRIGSGEVKIDADTTRTVDLSSSKVLDTTGAAYVGVRVGGRVAGAATYRKGGGIASLGLRAAPVTVLGPQVRPVS